MGTGVRTIIIYNWCDVIKEGIKIIVVTTYDGRDLHIHVTATELQRALRDWYIFM